MDQAVAYQQAFSPNSKQETPSPEKFGALVKWFDVDDDGDVDAKDIAILVGVSLAGFYFWRFAFKHLR